MHCVHKRFLWLGTVFNILIIIISYLITLLVYSVSLFTHHKAKQLCNCFVTVVFDQLHILFVAKVLILYSECLQFYLEDYYPMSLSSKCSIFNEICKKYTLEIRTNMTNVIANFKTCLDKFRMDYSKIGDSIKFQDEKHFFIKIYNA